MSFVRILADTNVIISAILFGSNCRQIIELIIRRQVAGVTSPQLLAELADILRKKFRYPKSQTNLAVRQLRQNLLVVQPDITVDVCRDEADNRVLEAAIVGGCDFVITGDKDLLELKVYKKIRIITPKNFRNLI